jgi:oxygen-independent coproporphyrinogen-3 oxidase
VVEEEIISRDKQMAETLMMYLRFTEGIPLAYFQDRFGVSVEEVYPRTLQKLFHLKLIERVNGYLRLTQEGLYVANEVFIEFLDPEL